MSEPKIKDRVSDETRGDVAPESEQEDTATPEQKLRAGLSEAIVDAAEGPFNTLLARVEEAAWGAVKEAEPVIERLCARVVELEATASSLRDSLAWTTDHLRECKADAQLWQARYQSSVETYRDVTAAESKANAMLQQAIVENNKLRAELRQANLVGRVCEDALQRQIDEQAKEIDMLRAAERRGGMADTMRKLYDEASDEAAKANEKLAQIEETLDASLTTGWKLDSIRSILAS